ncbi:Gfo/Idh/MocA family protein [Streptomyces sp. NBC_00499]|uniref:Gfo/Idh/MocA family protein n=2 Tax=unclassified Streptomyces TaxID=2593676 RepID=UPI0030E219DD
MSHMSHMTHRVIANGPEDPLRVLLVGAGGMGRAWLRALAASPTAALVGIVDLDLEAARDAARETGRRDLPVGADAVRLAAQTGAQAIVNVTVPAAHHPVTTAALTAGLPVLGEKPVAPTVASALSLAAAAEVTGELFMVSQSRRWNPQVFALRSEVTERLGQLGGVTTEFYRAPRFGGFRDTMPYPLLVDMAIHPFDTARFLIGAEPVAVYCESYNPPWSWYAGDAAASAVFEFAGGVRYSYHGSWCQGGDETSWNGRWRLSGEKGTALWDGETPPTTDPTATTPLDPVRSPDGIAGALEVFTAALRTGTVPMGEVHENILSLAMVEAAVESARTGRRVLIDDVLAKAYEEAVRDERDDRVGARLREWGSPRSVLSGTTAVPG